MEQIIIRDAYEHNLKHVNLEIPLNLLTCVTGCSGCGKSSLVYDTIYAESQRGFWEGMTGNYCGQKLMNKPNVGSVENLRPALSVSQNYYNINPRSSVGTVTEIAFYLRSLFALLNSSVNHPIRENLFSFNNPESCCPNCAGLGVETIVSESLLIPEIDSRLCDGAILFFNGPGDGKEYKTLEALCDYYHIDINKKISELSKNELQILLYANDKIKYKITYKIGKRRKTHYIFLQGAVSAICDKISGRDNSTTGTPYSSFLENVTCHVCGGGRLRKEILKYKLNGMNYCQIENMELATLYSWLSQFDYGSVPLSQQKLVAHSIQVILCKIDFLIKLNLGYLSLNRSIPSLSGGERQRLRLAIQLTCPLKGLLYILDEPCKGLHYSDVSSIIHASRNLISKGNTIIAIEHNKQYLSAADKIITLGPVGGSSGGYIIHSDPIVHSDLVFKKKMKFKNYCEIFDINFRNIKSQNIRIPIGGITCITGVSGSGKSSLVSVISQSFKQKGTSNFDFMKCEAGIKNVLAVNQFPIGKSPRSTVVSYLDIFDEIRLLFSHTPRAKALRLNASSFSMNVQGGRCECCQGLGLQKIDLNFLPSTYITCPECGGKRFNETILSVTYNGINIYDVLEYPISEIINIFSESTKITTVLQCLLDLGLPYLKLGQMSMHLSGGEAQRIKLAKALGNFSHGHNLYILDEPTIGLNAADISRFEHVLCSLQKNQETIVIVEHNLEFVAKIADYVIDLGIHGGCAGGHVVAQGITESVFKNQNSSLFDFYCASQNESNQK